MRLAQKMHLFHITKYNTMKQILASFYNPNLLKNNYPPFFRQTEGFSGKFNNIQYKLNDFNADWQIIGTWVQNIDIIKDKKLIYIQEEPLEIKTPDSTILDNCYIALTPFKLNHKIKQYLTYTLLQWTYDLDIVFKKGIGHCIKQSNNRSLEDLIYKKIPKKEKLCSMIASTKFFLPGHKKRINFTKAIINHFKSKIDFYGFGLNPIKNKKDAIDPYLFSIALENSSYNNYWTEKVADVFLGYTCPIYYGCKNLSSFFNKNSYIQIDINDIDKSIYLIEKVLEDPYSISFKNILSSRNKVLKKYNLFKTITDIINNEINLN